VFNEAFIETEWREGGPHDGEGRTRRGVGNVFVGSFPASSELGCSIQLHLSSGRQGLGPERGRAQ